MPKHPETASANALQNCIGYCFRNPELLQRALTHRSAAAVHMERLEFLGDAVLGAVIAARLHERFPEATEGDLSRMRASLVRREGLQVVARQWQLSSYLKVGEGERNVGGVKSPSIVANAVEAVIGAIYEDGGWEAASRAVLSAWQELIADVDMAGLRDAKTRLQEYTQAQGWGLPQYRSIDLGVGMSPRFSAECWIQGSRAGQGRGDRKKIAETRAAEMAWSRFHGE
ncbi:MAG TPA: ribonuclease III [Mariprofundaceae bacterium]|nr:ribonuclease III [Mariprofundaceae bacterium]